MERVSKRVHRCALNGSPAWLADVEQKICLVLTPQKRGPKPKMLHSW